MNCVVGWYYVEHTIFCMVNAILSILFSSELYITIKNKSVYKTYQSHATNQYSISLKKPEYYGNTRYILVLGGFTASFITLIRCIDPVPVWGIYNNNFIDFLSHLTTSVLFCCVFLTLHTFSVSIFNQVDVKFANALSYLIYGICTVLSLSSIITSFIFIWVSDVLFYSDGINTIITAISVLVFISVFILSYLRLKSILLKSLNHRQGINLNGINITSASNEKSVKSVKLLKKVLQWSLVACFIIWIIQSIYLINISDMEPFNPPNLYKKENNSRALFLWVHYFCLSVIMVVLKISKSSSSVVRLSELTSISEKSFKDMSSNISLDKNIKKFSRYSNSIKSSNNDDNSSSKSVPKNITKNILKNHNTDQHTIDTYSSGNTITSVQRIPLPIEQIQFQYVSEDENNTPTDELSNDPDAVLEITDVKYAISKKHLKGEIYKKTHNTNNDLSNSVGFNNTQSTLNNNNHLQFDELNRGSSESSGFYSADM